MVQTLPKSRSIRVWVLRGLAIFFSVATLSIAFLSWYLTAPIEKSSGQTATIVPISTWSIARRKPTWPLETLHGDAAKEQLISVLEAVVAHLETVPSYTATMKKQERIDDKLLPEQILAIKVRNHPFAFYGKFEAPKKGKEVVYAEGHNENHVIAHNGDWTRRLIPRLAVPPQSPLALKDSRHPVTEAGLHYLTRKLFGFRKLDLEDPDAGSILDWSEGPDGRLWPRSIHTHPHPSPTRPFARIEVLYDPVTLIPRQVMNFDWPANGQGGDLLLAERYLYLDLDLNAVLTDRDFDPANPDYAFHRF